MTDHLDPTDSAGSTAPDPWDAVARFLAGESSAGEAADVRKWLAEHPADAGVAATLDRLLPASAPDRQLAEALNNGVTLPFGRSIDVEAALRKVHTQMETVTPAPVLTVVGGARKATAPARPVAPPKRYWMGAAWAAAAAIVVVAGATRWLSSTDTATTVASVHETPVGASDTVVLADSSVVILAPGSKLTVAAGYGNGGRDVELQGEGQFTVVHDTERPFTVRSGSAIIRDLGTVFTVKALQGRGVVVSVTEGSVSMRDTSPAGSTRSLTLAAGDRGRLEADGSLVSELGSVTPDESAWLKGELVYHDASLADVQADLRRWYGVELVVRDTLPSMSNTNSSGKVADGVDKMMEKLALGWGATATHRGDTLFVDRSGDRPRN